MTLGEWRNLKNLTYAQLANAVGAPHPTVARRWCLPRTHRNAVVPSPKYLRNIMKLTCGAVQANDFYRDQI